MASEPAFHGFFEDPLSEPSAFWGEPSVRPPASNLNDAIEISLRARLVVLTQEHRDLDDAISLLRESNASDELRLSRLKKRRLHLKDEMARICDSLPA